LTHSSKAPGFRQQTFKLKCDFLAPNIAFTFSLYRYSAAEETGERLVAAESARKKGVGGIGGAGAAFRSASQRTGPGKLLYYTAEYTKSVLSVSRVVLTTLVVADGVLYTLTAVGLGPPFPTTLLLQ
jgi:hypothetical protein